jgi:hypothetical protein
VTWGGYRPDEGLFMSEGTVCAILSVQIYRPETGLLVAGGSMFVGGHCVRDFKRTSLSPRNWPPTLVRNLNS